MADQLKISIVVPAFNESKNLENGVLEEMRDYLKGVDYKYEVVVIDDGSTDDTGKKVSEFAAKNSNFRLVRNSHGGKAVAVMTGLLEAKGEVVLFTDMDQATPLNQLEKLLPEFERGYDVAIGSRQGRQGAPIIRKVSAWGFSLLRNIILGLPFKDTQCGFKAFNREAVANIFPDLLRDWQKRRANSSAVNAGFDVEILYLAKKRNLNIAEVRVIWHHVGTERVQFIRDAYDAVRDMIRIRLNDLFGKYTG